VLLVVRSIIIGQRGNSVNCLVGKAGLASGDVNLLQARH
jgi:hypothetical protein